MTNNELKRFTGGVGLAAQGFASIDQNSVAFIPDHLRSKAQQKQSSMGWLDPILNVKLFDIIRFDQTVRLGEDQFSIVSMTYTWPQYVNEIPRPILQEMFYEKLQNQLLIHPTSSKPLITNIENFNSSQKGTVFVARENTIIQPGMMVSFAGVDSVADLRILYGFVLSQDPRKTSATCSRHH